MTRACKLLIGHGVDFDGCCVPEKCANVTVPHDDVELQRNGEDDTDSAKNTDDATSSTAAVKGAREFKITDAPSNNKVTTTADEQVMILQRTDHSAVIELPKADNEAVLSIALTSEHNKEPANELVWKEHKIPQGLPQITLSDLLPSTSYTLKYSVNGKDSPAVQFITNG